jgi:hypothetical protein
MKLKSITRIATLTILAVSFFTLNTWAEIPVQITTPDKVESRIGTLDFKDGYPTKETAAKVRDELDYLHGVEAFMNSIQGVSL